MAIPGQKSILLLVVAFSIVSCGGGSYAVVRVGGSTQRVLVLDRNVEDTLLFIQSLPRQLPGGEILVRAGFQNRFAGEDVWAEIKFVFLDENKAAIDETEWMKTRFPASQVTTVQGSSITTQAKSYLILIRNIYTLSGNKPIGYGKLYEIPGVISILSR